MLENCASNHGCTELTMDDLVKASIFRQRVVERGTAFEPTGGPARSAWIICISTGRMLVEACGTQLAIA